jgi:hypothetical protein
VTGSATSSHAMAGVELHLAVSEADGCAVSFECRPINIISGVFLVHWEQHRRRRCSSSGLSYRNESGLRQPLVASLLLAASRADELTSAARALPT